MKPILLFALVAAALVSGCATSTPEKRRQERAAAYQQLAPDVKSAVDQGRIQVGMNMDAVYIALGKPSQVVESESAAGRSVTWLYHGSYLQETRYWAYRDYCWNGYYQAVPRLEYDYLPRTYIRAEVTFEKGLVKAWRSLPVPY